MMSDFKKVISPQKISLFIDVLMLTYGFFLFNGGVYDRASAVFSMIAASSLVIIKIRKG